MDPPPPPALHPSESGPRTLPFSSVGRRSGDGGSGPEETPHSDRTSDGGNTETVTHSDRPTDRDEDERVDWCPRSTVSFRYRRDTDVPTQCPSFPTGDQSPRPTPQSRLRRRTDDDITLRTDEPRPMHHQRDTRP